MNFPVCKDKRTKQLLCGLAAALIALISEYCNGSAVKGLYVGSDFYAPNESTQNAARASGLNRLFLSFFHIDAHGDVTFNNTPVVRNGIYVGDPSWGIKLGMLEAPPAGINRLELVIGDGPEIEATQGETFFTNIRKLIASQGTGPTSVLYKDFQVLKTATGAEAIQLIDEHSYDAPSTLALSKMIAALGMKVTVCTYSNRDFWVNLKSQLGANLDAIYLMCYGDGASCDPGPWTQTFGSFTIYPGLWGNTDTATSTMMKMRNWRRTLGITGGFMWLNGFLPSDAGRWAGTLAYGLDPIASLRIVNKGSGKSLNLIYGSLTNGSAISQSGYDDSNYQRWMLVPAESGDHFKIVSWTSGKYASIAYDSSMAGAQLWAWDYNNDSSQQFDLIDAGNGWFEIKNVRSGLVLEVAGGSTSDNAVIEQNTDTGASSQMWKFYPYQAPLLAFENFDYPTGKLSGLEGGDGWNGAWSDDLNPGTVVSPRSLIGGINVPPGYDAQSSGNSAFIPNDKRAARYLDCSASGNFGVYGYLDPNGRIGADGKTLYISFLEQPLKTSLFYEFELKRGAERIAGIGNDTHTDDINLRAPGDAFTPIAHGNTNINFFVMRIDFQPGNDDVRIYYNPASTTEPDMPALNAPGIADMSFNRISLAAFANSNAVQFDQIRMAGTWEQAIAASPEFAIDASSNIVGDDIFRQVRISGQVLCSSADKYYLLDGNTGVQILLTRPIHFEPGDTVVATGLVEHKGQFVNLVEAEATMTGHAPLPQPQPLDVSNSGQCPWVFTEGILTGLKDNGIEQILELQAGSRKLIARLQSVPGTPANWQIGSRVKLTGVYLQQAGGGQEQSPGQMLLNSPAAVQIMARAPWWTMERAMIAMGLLMAGLGLAFVWITSLQRQVNRQTIRLRSEITQREQAERARAIEEERSRISRDLHDDLGSILTQINMLSSFTPGAKLAPDLMHERIQQISKKSHRMITALDEVVWMMNSRNESVSSLAAYLTAYAEEFLAKTNIVCRIDAPRSYPEKSVTAEVRNNVFSSVKEAINNAVRHGKPGKVLLKLSTLENQCEIQINDDGCGFDPSTVKPGNGLANLQLRMKKIGGIYKIQSSPDDGTTIVLQFSLVPSPGRLP